MALPRSYNTWKKLSLCQKDIDLCLCDICESEVGLLVHKLSSLITNSRDNLLMSTLIVGGENMYKRVTCIRVKFFQKKTIAMTFSEFCY